MSFTCVAPTRFMTSVSQFHCRNQRDFARDGRPSFVGPIGTNRFWVPDWRSFNQRGPSMFGGRYGVGHIRTPSNVPVKEMYICKPGSLEPATGICGMVAVWTNVPRP